MAKDVSFPIRINPEMMAAIKWACDKTGWSQQNISRLAIQIGLKHLERIKHDLAGSIIDATPKVDLDKITATAMLLEQPTEYGTKKERVG